MKKFINLILMCLFLSTLVGCSSGPSREEVIMDKLNKEVETWNTQEKFINKSGIVLASASTFTDIDGYIHIDTKWSTNSPYIELVKKRYGYSGDDLFDRYYTSEDYVYIANVKEFPDVRTDIIITAEMEFEGVHFSKDFKGVLVSKETNFLVEKLKGWGKRDNTLVYSHHYESGLVKNGQPYYDIYTNADWHLDTNIANVVKTAREGRGGSAKMWLAYKYIYTYDVNTQTLTLDGFSIALNKTYTTEDYNNFKNMGMDWKRPINEFSSVLHGINNYLTFKGKDELRSVPEAYSADKLFGL